ncbi:MAG TPA: type I-MYXAN CRISPR-associated protein Cas6/Cmx6 [Candidatus Accumulibacter phosphatis]|nr:type I-MYXAN CRISPR-associated protein Cas6/Cmx6 [Accumulibacter sp.]HRL74356.1 type I-MYXAN CRISPR-associated protein Cas6/Cmx6 [Candidatus Accumulibacter phosphatis]HRQ95343.1 type I-MYXAN CRISPR-associated protein Cas6/Cmx6 [Candidatus Accumulibacter phosphatis]
MESPRIDLLFPLHGHEIPLDHGYALYAALSHALESATDPWLHTREDVGLHLIRGSYRGKGRLALSPASRIAIRLPVTLVHKFLLLAGQQLTLGTDPLRLGIPQPQALQPAPALYAHLVTTRNGQDESRFDTEMAHQLAELAIRGSPQRGPRRSFTIKDRKVVAHTLLVSELTAEESIRLQEHGLGGRRKLGCGVFVPWQTR